MQNSVNRNSSVPMYRQISELLEKRISSGEFEQGQKLPPEVELMKEYGVSRITVRAAIEELVKEGIIERTQGKGSFISVPKSLYKLSDTMGFTRTCLLAGRKPVTKVFARDLVEPNKKEKEFFGMTSDDKLVCIKRLRFADDDPLAVETNHYPMSMAYLLNENLDCSLMEVLKNKYDIVIGSSLRTLEIAYSTPEESKLLNIKSRTPLLLFEDWHRDSENRPLFTSKQVYCSERLKFYL